MEDIMFDDELVLKRTEHIKKYLAEKADALTSLDEGQIKRFCEKWRFKLLYDSDSDVFWIGVHIARALDVNIPRDKRADSAIWLAERGIDLKGYVT